jgi:hypothetical protein
MITKGVELEGLLAEFRIKEKQKEELIQQLRQEIAEKDDFIEKNEADIEIMRATHQNELQQVSSQLGLSTERLQKVQGEEMRFRQLQMRIDELQADLERSERENAEKVCLFVCFFIFFFFFIGLSPNFLCAFHPFFFLFFSSADLRPKLFKRKGTELNI